MVIEEDADDNGDIEKYEDALAEKLALQLGDLAESRKSEKWNRDVKYCKIERGYDCRPCCQQSWELAGKDA